jgi:septation ring formation regulator EzrA
MLNLTSYIVRNSDARNIARKLEANMRSVARKLDTDAVPELPHDYSKLARDDWRLTFEGARALVRGEVS